MWVITKSGFISAVQHEDDPTMLRVRTRTLEHMEAAFGGLDIIDFGPKPSDYRYHCNVPRLVFEAWMTREIQELDYTSHVKENVSGDDDEMYAAMMSCW